MKKVINPCTCPVYDGRMAQGFVKIEFEDGRLSISGVIGPRRSGNCSGSAGQCVDEIREGIPTEEWSAEMLAQLCDIWDRWHLNDMRPYCQHMKTLGWNEEARQSITLYHYTMTKAASDKKRDAEKAAIKALCKGETFTPTAEQAHFASMPYSITTYGEQLSGRDAENYEPKKSLFPGDKGPTETKIRGWVTFEKDSDLGILSKPCPVCGYKYGHAWQKEEVPKEVIDWLFALPDTTREPAWV